MDPAILAGFFILAAYAAYYAFLHLLGRRGRAEEGLEAVAFAAALFGAALATPWLVAQAVPQMGNATAALKAMNYTGALLISAQEFGQAANAAKDFLFWWQTSVAIYSLSTVLYPVGSASSIALGIPAQLAQIVAEEGYVLAALCYALLPLPPFASLAAVLIASGRTRALGAFVLALATIAPAVLAISADSVGSMGFSAGPPTITKVLSEIARYVVGYVIDIAPALANAAIDMSAAVIALAAFTAVGTWAFAKAAHYFSIAE